MVENYLNKMIAKYKKLNDCTDKAPLDGDEVDELVEIIKAELNLDQGNITRREYEDFMANEMWKIPLGKEYRI